jgi:predicted O-methyltransferase YrrM
MNFTQDWFSHNIPNFQKCMDALGDKRSHFLEIGSYEGRSACWLLQNALPKDGFIECIDPFPNMPEVEQRFWENTREVAGGRVVCQTKNTSYKALAKLIGHGQQIDFVYIDGSHDPAATLTDAAMAWGLLRSGGVMLFDDYEYPQEPTKCGIDGFLMGFVGKYDLLLKNYQLAVVKK